MNEGIKELAELDHHTKGSSGESHAVDTSQSCIGHKRYLSLQGVLEVANDSINNGVLALMNDGLDEFVLFVLIRLLLHQLQ